MIPNEWLQFAPKPKEIKPDEWHVFLSYRSINRPWVLSLYDILTELGYKVFLDQYVLRIGDVLITTLENALEKSHAGILIWSSAAQDSEWVRKEYNTFETMATENKRFQFIPVVVDKTQLPPFAKTKVFTDFTDYPEGPNGGDLLKLLYAISGEPLTNEVIHFATQQDEISKEEDAKLRAALRNNQASKLIQLFEQGGLAWKTTASLGCKAAEGLIKLKKYDDATAMLEKLEQQFNKSLRPKQLKALALARRGNEGDLDDAQEILGVLYEKNNLDPETMGIYARTWMDRYAKTNDIADLKQSRELYATAFEKAPDDYYTGINAAAKSVFIGTATALKAADEYAARVQLITGTEAAQGDYWKTATIAETLLIQKKYTEAAEMYEKAIAMAITEKGSHESTYLQATRLMEKLKPTKEEREMIDEAFGG